MTNLKAKLAELLSPMGAGNNAYELGQLAQQQQALIEVLVKSLIECDEAMEYMSEYDIPICLPDNVKQARLYAKDCGYL